MSLTDLSFLEKGQVWPPKGEQKRLERMSGNKRLFEGDHWAVFSDWIRLLRDDKKATMEIIINFHKRLSLLWGDLLFGETPKIRAEAQETLDAFIEQNELVLKAYQVVLDLSRYGTGIFKLRYNGTRTVVDVVPPNLWFPVVSEDDIRETKQHVLAWEYEKRVPAMMGYKTFKFLKVEIHERDKVTTRTYTLKDNMITGMLEESVVEHNLDEFLVIPVFNIIPSDKIHGIDDYKDLDSLVQEIMIRFGQIARILDKHADPNMYGPDSAMELDPETGEYVFRGGGKYFPIAPGEDAPGYVVWDGRIESSFKEIEMLMEQLYLVSETTPAAFGQMKNGLAESGSALKRLLMAPLAHVNRIRMQFDPKLKKVITLANRLEIEYGELDSDKIDKVAIEWQDGLPKDDKEVADIEVQKYSVGLSSLRMSLEKLENLEGDALLKAVEEIVAAEKEKAEFQSEMEIKKAKATAVTNPKDPNNPTPKAQNKLKGRTGGKE
jgi:hypothetical protein